jgi:hypothetical protein
VTENDLRYLDLVKVMKLPNSNNVVVSFLDENGILQPAITIGRKQLVTLLEKLATEISPIKWPAAHARACELAAETRGHLWPRTL